MADTVAQCSLSICACMDSQQETLVTYAKHFGKVEGYISWATMNSIDSKVSNTSTAIPSPQPHVSLVRPSVRTVLLGNV